MNVLRQKCDAVGARVGIDPIIVTTAIMAVVQLITVCMTEPTPDEIARTAKRPNRRQARRMERAVFNELWSRGLEEEFGPVMREIRAEINSMTPDEIGQCCLDCTDGTGDYGD